MLSAFTKILQIQYLFIVLFLTCIGMATSRNERVSLVIFIAFFVVLITVFLNDLEEIFGWILFRTFCDSEIFASCLNIFFLCTNVLIVKLIPKSRFEHTYDFFKHTESLYHGSFFMAFLLIIFSE